MGARRTVVVAWLVAGLLGPGLCGADAGAAAEATLDLFTPEQLARGRTTEVTVRVGKDTLVQSVEVTPSAGISVSGAKPLDKCGASILIGIRGAETTPKGAGKSLVRATIEDAGSSLKEPTVCDLDLELADKKGYKGRLKTAVALE